jgi:uncharacterized protein YutE (UPF0331/DUF86 family)
LVDRERVAARLDRLRDLLERLEGVKSAGEETYLASFDTRAMTERCLELSIQICIDVGTQVLMEGKERAPESYAEVFTALAHEGVLPDDLGERLAEAAKQRNFLVHAYMDIDDRKVFASLGSIDDLRQFAAVIGRDAV